MNERQCSEIVTEWIGDELDAPAEARYPYAVAAMTGPLTTEQPAVAAIAERKRTMLVTEAQGIFPFLEIQQLGPLVRVFDVGASVILAVEDSEASAKEVFQRLQGFGEKLEASALSGDTLGERVQLIAPSMAFDYSNIYAEDSSGIRGRELVIALTVGETMDGEL